MATFPTRENDVMALADDLIKGLTRDAEIFPSPPTSAEELQASFDKFQQAREAAATADGAARDAHGAKDEALDELTDKMKADLKYAEITTDQDEGKLNLIGWGAPRARNRLDRPGRARDLEVVRSGKGWIYLDWKPPVEGGDVAAYKVQCSHPEEDLWKNAGTAIETELLLNDQERGVDLVYHVIAMNRAGEALPSNIVRVVL
jgi:hypothetical protein